MTYTIIQYNTHANKHFWMEREKGIVELVKELNNESVDFINVELGIENELTNIVNQTLLLKVTSG